jgi:V8-like Glu-specific endopeptidase
MVDFGQFRAKIESRKHVRNSGGALLLLLTVSFLPAWADQLSLPIGRLNHAGYKHLQHCTATLVAPQVAVTALHCIVPNDVPNMHLLVGYNRGSWHDHLQPVTAVSASSPGDIAILCLDRPSTVEPVRIADHPADLGERVLVVGYGKPRVQIANRKACRVSDLDETGEFQLDCPLTSGTSGAPVLRETGTGYEIIGIVSATNSTRSVAYWFVGEDVAAACNPALRNNASDRSH